MVTREHITDMVRERQRATGESDGQFARRLGISRQMWQGVRTGQRDVGTETLQRITAAFPELLPYVVSLFLPSDATNVTSPVTNEAEATA